MRREYEFRTLEMHLRLRQATQNNIVFLWTAILKHHSKCKTKIYNKHTQKNKRESKHNTTESYQITIEKSKRGKERKKSTKTNLKHLRK